MRAFSLVGLDWEYVIVAVIGEELAQPFAFAVLAGGKPTPQFMKEEMPRKVKPRLKSFSVHSMLCSTSSSERSRAVTS